MTQVLKNRKLADAIWARYNDGLTRGHSEYHKQAKENENFYFGAGSQWTEEEKAKLGDRPWLEENLIFSIINTVVGYQTQSRMDITFKPREDGDSTVAETVSKVGMFVLDNNRYPWVEKQVFEDGLIQQRGYFDVRMNFDNNAFGEIEISTEDPLDIMPDPDSKSYNPDDWADVIKTKWMTVDDIAITYGNRKANLVKRHAAYNESDFGVGDIGQERNKFGNSNYSAPYHNDKADVLHARVLERQYWKLDTRLFWVMPDSGDLDEVPQGMTMKEAKKDGRDVVRRLVKRIRWTVSTQDVILHDDWSPYDHFTIVPYFPFFRRGRTLGLVDNLISTQKMINKVYSQILHIVNTTANSGWKVEANSLSNMETEELEEHGATTGLVIEYKSGRNPPEKIEPNTVPTGLDRLLNSGVDLIQTISGVPASMKGENGPEVTGIAIQSRVQQAATQLASPIDNLFFTRNLLAERILKLIQAYMTEPRILNITGHDTAEEDATVAINQEVETEDGSIEVLNDVTAGKYDVVIADVPTQITFKQAQLSMVLELIKYGIPVPPEEVVLLTDLSRKEQIAKKVSGENPEAQEMQRQQMEATIAELQKQVQKLAADSKNKDVDSVKKAAETAAMLAENPGLTPVVERILNYNVTPSNEVSAPGSDIPVT